MLAAIGSLLAALGTGTMWAAITQLIHDLLGSGTTGLIGGLTNISTQGNVSLFGGMMNLSSLDSSPIGQTINGLFLPLSGLWHSIVADLAAILALI